MTAAILPLPAPSAADVVVERRGDEAPVEGTLLRDDDAGVRIRSLLGAEHFVPWDRIRDIRTDHPIQGLEERLRVATELWRARSRVERRDAALAEPILERHFERYRSATHEAALVVAEGLLRCRVARGDHVLAVIPALEVARMRRAGVTTASYSGLDAIIDEPAALCPALAPVWMPTPLLEPLERELASYDAQGDQVVGAIAALYRALLRQALRRPIESLPPLPDHEGVELLRLLLECGDADAERRFDRPPEWAEAWARFHVGMSLLAEDGLGRRQQGMVSLTHVPARFARSQPHLARLALVALAEALDQTGDRAAADSLRGEIARNFPDQPTGAVAPQAPGRAPQARGQKEGG
jgi:hypothetical protein